MDLLTEDEIDQALSDDLPGWEQDGNAITREIEAPTFLDGITLVQHVAEAAENMDHHPDIDIRYNSLKFKLSTHSEGGLTAKDTDLAGKISTVIDAKG